MPKKSVNPTFASMAWIRDLNATMAEKTILYSLASRIGSDYTAWPSRKRLAKDAGIKSMATISKTAQALEEKGLLQVTKVIKKDGSQRPNRYRLLVPPQYKSNTTPSVDPMGGSTGVSLKLSSNNCPTNYTGGIDKPKEETGDASASLVFAPNKDQECLQEDFPVSAKYLKNTKSAKARVCFWWEVLQNYRPDAYACQKKLTKYQFKALMEYFGIFSDPEIALYTIELTVRKWELVVKFAKAKEYICSTPKQPTATWILKNVGSCVQYYEGGH